MKSNWSHLFVTQDEGLLKHWQQALGKGPNTMTAHLDALLTRKPARPSVAWVDLSLPGRLDWTTSAWRDLLASEHIRVVAASSNPRDPEAMAALDAGCAAYCHAYSDAPTLKQVREVVEAGHVWIGKALMQRLLRGVNHAVATRPPPEPTWSEGLTQRETEVAILAANGASNLAIAQQCRISERTVKAHLSAIFGKLNITDRLQLALRVHGIH
jgi:DNA-binding NarL/FixJ family response regulator